MSYIWGLSQGFIKDTAGFLHQQAQSAYGPPVLSSGEISVNVCSCCSCIHKVDCKACWKQSLSPTWCTYGTFFHVGETTSHLHTASAGNIKKLLSADDPSVPTPLSFTSLQTVPIVPLVVSEKFGSLFLYFKAEPESQGLRLSPVQTFVPLSQWCWCCAFCLPCTPSGACWWREWDMQAVAGSPKSRAGAGAWALCRDP